MTDPTPAPAVQTPTPFRTIEDVISWGITERINTRSTAFTYRSFNVIDNGTHMLTVQLGRWNPHLSLFKPVGELVLSESAASLLITKLQAFLDAAPARLQFDQYIASILSTAVKPPDKARTGRVLLDD